MKLFIRCSLVSLLVACGLRLGAQDPPIPEDFLPIRIDVPAELEKVHGNGSSPIPFGFDLGQSIRFQQVFEASQFSKLPKGGGFLTWFQDIRGACGSTVVAAAFTNVEVRLSSTSRAPDTLSPTFSENIGADEVIAFQGRKGTGGGGNCSEFGGTGIWMLDTPFFYDPGSGRHLLLELRVSDPNYTEGGKKVRMETHSVTNDSISRVAAFSSTATKAEVVDTAGLIATFIFHAAPALHTWSESNNLVIAWSRFPEQFGLQWAGGLTSSYRWENYSEAIDRSSGFPTAVIPVSSLVEPRYFRLFWDSPQPGLVIPPRTLFPQ